MLHAFANAGRNPNNRNNLRANNRARRMRVRD